MAGFEKLDDLELAALVASKVCHDLIGPVGAIFNGIEVLDEEDDEDSRAFAFEQIRNYTEQASAKLQFARFAFGAAGGPGARVGLKDLHEIAQGFVGKGRHRLVWQAAPGPLESARARLLLNLLANALVALPRGGEIALTVAGEAAGESGAQSFRLCCRGERARVPEPLTAMVEGRFDGELNALTVQPYYTLRLAATAAMILAIDAKEGEVVLSARSC